MIISLLISLFIFNPPEMILYDFMSGSESAEWYVVDDNVMGGRSEGKISVSEEGYGIFEGDVSLENNGGFSSIRYRFDPVKVENFSKAMIYLKGDGKSYQFRLKSKSSDRHSYIAYFKTSGEKEVIEIDLSKMEPGFRGFKPNLPDYPGKLMEEISFLISNKKAESFRLEIDKIVLK